MHTKSHACQHWEGTLQGETIKLPTLNGILSPCWGDKGFFPTSDNQRWCRVVVGGTCRNLEAPLRFTDILPQPPSPRNEYRGTLVPHTKLPNTNSHKELEVKKTPTLQSFFNKNTHPKMDTISSNINLPSSMFLCTCRCVLPPLWPVTWRSCLSMLPLLRFIIPILLEYRQQHLGSWVMSLTKYGHDHKLAMTLPMIHGCFVYSLEDKASWLSGLPNHKQFGSNSHFTKTSSLLCSLSDACKFGWSPRTVLPVDYLQDYLPPSLMSLTFQPMSGLIHWPPTIV